MSSHHKSGSRQQAAGSRQQKQTADSRQQVPEERSPNEEISLELKHRGTIIEKDAGVIRPRAREGPLGI
jgi:hypothetical protein